MATSSNAFPGYRVFVYGVEVSADVISVSVTGSDDGNPGTCSIEIASPRNKYVFTVADVWNAYHKDRGSAVEAMQSLANPFAPPRPALSGNLPPKLATTENWVKDSVIRAKKAVNDSLRESSDRLEAARARLSSVQILQETLEGDALQRYEFKTGYPIFHANDPVRVALRDPFQPGRWYWAFAGFVSDVGTSTTEDDRTTVSLACEDALRPLRLSRYAINPGIISRLSQLISQLDAALVTPRADPFAGMTLPDIFFSMIFGPDVANTSEWFRTGTAYDPSSSRGVGPSDGVRGYEQVQYSFEGIGHFNDISFSRSRVFVLGGVESAADIRSHVEAKLEEAYRRKVEAAVRSGGSNVPPERLGSVLLQHNVIQKVDSLSAYLAEVDHEVKRSDARTMAHGVNALMSDDELPATIDETITLIGTRTDMYPVDGGRLIMLLPSTFGETNDEVVSRNIAATPFQLHSTNFTTRLNALRDVVRRIDFVMYASPRGDILVEFPLVDFNPDHLDPPGGGVVFDSEKNVRGPFQPRHVFTNEHTEKWSATFNDSKVYTMSTSSWQIRANYDLGTFDQYSPGGSVTVVDAAMLFQYGARAAPLNPRGYIETPEGARAYAALTLNLLNADAYSMNIDVLQRPSIWINRPIFFEGPYVVGTTRKVTHSIVWAASADTKLDVKSVRSWTGKLDSDGKPIFTPMGGEQGKPWAYDKFFQVRRRSGGGSND